MTLKTLLAAAALAVSAISPSFAATLNFDGTDPAATVLNSSGFNYRWTYDEIDISTTQANFNGYFIYGRIDQAAGELRYDATWNGNQQPMVLRPGANGDTTFDLSSIRIANTRPNADGVRITGYALDWSAVTLDVTSANGTFVDLTFGAAWSGLRQVNISNWYTGGQTGITSFNIDSIGVNNTVAAVPLPAGLPLLLTALGGLGYLRRKRAG